MVDIGLVSIIIPVYNGEQHISKCIEDLLKQTYSNIEIIVVNDGSEDSTAQIVNEWRIRDNRVKPIHKENTGVSDTRNIGIASANGNYIIFVDSDDFLLHQAIEQLADKVYVNKSDMILFGFSVVGSKNRSNDTDALIRINKSSNMKEEIIHSILATNNNIFGYIWRAIYLKNMLLDNNIIFPKGIKISEDYMFLLNAVNCSQNITIDPCEYYIYVINESSMSIKYIPTLLHDMTYVNDWMYESLVKCKESLYEGYYCSVCNTYLRFVQNTIRNRNINFRQKLKLIQQSKKEYNFQKEINKVWYKYKNFTIKSEVGMVLFRFHLDFVYAFLFELKEKRHRR